MTSSLMPVRARNHRVFAFDRPGHGYSDRLPYHAWAEAQAVAIHEGVRRLGLEKPVIVGHSMGGAVAIAYGMAYPDELTGIVFLSGAGFAEVPGGWWKFIRPAAPVNGEVLSYTLYRLIQPHLVRSLLRKFFAPQQIPEYLLREMLVEMLRRPKAIKSNSEDQMVTVLSMIDLHMHYKTYPLSVVIMAGNEDQTTDPGQHAILLSEKLPDATLRLFPGLGHMIHQFAQEEIAKAIQTLESRNPDLRLEDQHAARG